MRFVPLLAILLPATLHAQYSRERVSLVLRGEAALQRQEISTAMAAFREASRDTSVARRAAAERMLGVIAWRFYKDNGTARLHFGSALATQFDTAATYVEMARLAVAEGRYSQAYFFAERALRSATDDNARRGAAIQLGKLIAEMALGHRIDGVAPADRLPVGAEGEVIAALRDLVRREPGRTEEAHDLLIASIVAGNGAAAAEAVRSYYLVDVGGPMMRSTIPATVAELERLFAQWPSDATPNLMRSKLVSALVRARQYDAAALLAPAGSEVVEYERFCRRIAREADEYYRRALVGDQRADALTRSYIHATHDLWPRLTWNGTPPTYYPAAADVELSRRFGTLVQLGITGGFYDLHMGHVVGDERRTVTQYGRSARVHFVVIDGIVTNGLQSWAWDDAGGHGGWQRRDTIVQVRPIFVEHAMSLWVSGAPSRRAHEERSIAVDSATDLAIARTDSIGYLPGVASRLRRDGRDAIIDSLRRAGVADSTLRREFVRVVSRLIRESSIIAHEGRHAIDDGVPQTLTPEDREFHAKLSEIAFVAHPKIVMSSIIHPNIGDATPHGRANARVMLGLIRWMRAHGSEISGFDQREPVLVQLPLLTDEQFRKAFRSMDPLARGS